MLVYYFVPFIVSNRYLLFRDSNGHKSVTVQNRTHVYMNVFYHKDLGNHLLQLCPKVVKHPVYIDISFEKGYLTISMRQHTHIHTRTHMHARTHARTHTHTHLSDTKHPLFLASLIISYEANRGYQNVLNTNIIRSQQKAECQLVQWSSTCL